MYACCAYGMRVCDYVYTFAGGNYPGNEGIMKPNGIVFDTMIIQFTLQIHFCIQCKTVFVAKAM